MNGDLRFDFGSFAQLKGLASEAVRFFHQDKGQAEDIGQLDPAGFDQGMSGGQGEEEFILHEGLKGPFLSIDRGADQGEVECALTQEVEEDIGGLFRDVKAQVRIAFGGCGDEGGKKVGGDGGNRTDAQSSPRFTGKSGGIFLRVFDFLEDAQGALKKAFAKGGGDGSALAPLEEGLPQFRFELFDLMAEGGLGDMAAGGGPGEIPDAHDFDKVSELVQFHRCDLWF